MRCAWRATDAATARRRPAGGATALVGLFCAVWALALQFSLPLATALGTQLSGGIDRAGYDLIPALTGRIHRGHGSAGKDHSLPVHGDVAALLSKSETASLHGADGPVVVRYQRAKSSPWAVRPHGAAAPLAIDHAHLSRAPPFLQASRQTV